MQRASRRQMLAALGVSAASSVFAGCSGTLENVSQADESPKQTQGPSRDWSYAPLDPADVAARAYRMYPDGSCMYAVFGAIVAALAERVGEPFASFPIGMMRYGHSGEGGWGSLCGTINGGAAALGLFHAEKEKDFRDGLIEELFTWYERAELPRYRPADAGPDDEAYASVAGSVLCHVSVHHWCEAASADAYCPERKERCRRLSADVAARTVEILNRVVTDRALCPGLATEVKACISCHGQREIADVSAKMDCRTCHSFDRPHP